MPPGVGMPAALMLDEFGSQVYSAFGSPPYLVGSALDGKQWRDVDVRLILSDEDWDAMGLGDPRDTHRNGKWVALCLAFAALGKQMTGLPIDFQIQRQTEANAEFNKPRSALGIVSLRIRDTGERHHDEIAEAAKAYCRFVGAEDGRALLRLSDGPDRAAEMFKRLAAALAKLDKEGEGK